MSTAQVSTRTVALTTSFQKVSSIQTERQFLAFGGLAQVITYAFVPYEGTAPTVGLTLAANGILILDNPPAGDLYMKAAAAGNAVLIE